MVLLYMVSAEHPVHESALKGRLKNLLKVGYLLRAYMPAYAADYCVHCRHEMHLSHLRKRLTKIDAIISDDIYNTRNTKTTTHRANGGLPTHPAHTVFFSVGHSCTCDDMSSSTFSEALRTTSSETDGFRGKADNFLLSFMQ